LIKADLVTLSIGNEELFYKMKTEKPDDLFAEILFVAFHGVDPLPFLSEVRL